MHASRVAIAVLALGITFASQARAEESAYCRRVQARAAGDAAILQWPRAVVQGIRFPSDGRVDVGPTAADRTQVRAALAFSPLDFYRGIRVRRVGDADCSQHETSGEIERLLEHGTDAARLAALREQAAYLDGHRDEWRAVVARAQERLAARIVTLLEFDDVRRLADVLEHKLVATRGEMSQLAATSPEAPRESLESLARRYFEQTMSAEQERSALRALDPWQVQVTGGVVPLGRVDWYGVAEVSFNLGAFSHARHEEEYLDARAAELRETRYELGARLKELGARAAAAVDEARSDLEVAEKQLAFALTTRAALEKSDAPGAANARDALAIEEVSVQSDVVFLRALVRALSPFAGGHGE
jgi:hypothetical protein